MVTRARSASRSARAAPALSRTPAPTRPRRPGDTWRRQRRERGPGCWCRPSPSPAARGGSRAGPWGTQRTRPAQQRGRAGLAENRRLVRLCSGRLASNGHCRNQRSMQSSLRCSVLTLFCQVRAVNDRVQEGAFKPEQKDKNTSHDVERVRVCPEDQKREEKSGRTREDSH